MPGKRELIAMIAKSSKRLRAWLRSRPTSRGSTSAPPTLWGTTPPCPIPWGTTPPIHPLGGWLSLAWPYEGAASASPDPLGRNSASPVGDVGPQGLYPVSNYYRYESKSSEACLWHQEEIGHTSTGPHGRYRPCLGGDVARRDVRISAVLPNAYMVFVRGVRNPCHPRDGGAPRRGLVALVASIYGRRGAIPIRIYRVGRTHTRRRRVMGPKSPFSPFSLSCNLHISL